MEIRAKIALEVAKFQANAKVVVGQFKAMGTGAERFQNNVDHYAKRSLDRTKQLGVERVRDTSKAGEAILAREKKLADDRYSVIMAGAQRAQKAKSKLEQDAVRNTGGIRAGTNVGRPLPVRDVTSRQDAITGRNSAYNKMAAKEQAAYEKDLARQFKQLEKEKAEERRKFLKAQEADTKRYNAWLKNAYKQEAREYVTWFAQAVKEKNAAAKQAAKVQAEAAKQAARAQADAARRAAKEEIAAYNAINKHYADLRRKQEALAKKSAKNMKFRQEVEFVMNDADFNRRLASTRYALYDIGQRAAMVGVAITGAMVAAVQSAIKFESAFTSVERTTQTAGKEAQALKQTFIDMSTAIPVAFEDLTKIATLGAQLGIAKDEIDDFTETVAKFGAITGISVEQVGMSFGRLSQLMDVPASQFENLSSAVAFTGVNAVATDAEILSMSESIAAVSNQAGIAAADTIGFAAALASLKVRPEEARGVLTRLFREFDLSVSQGGRKLDDLSKVLGVTSEEAAKLWEQDASGFVQEFLRGANASGKLNETITALGITNSRELNVITRLANNMDVLTSSLADANSAFTDGSYSSEAYGVVADDLASKITMMQNALAAAGAAFGEIAAGPIGILVDMLKNVAQGFANLDPFMKGVIGITAALAAGIAFFVASLTFGIAALLALKLGMQNLKIEGVQAGISVNTFRAILVSLIPNAGAATGVMSALRNSFTAVTTGATGASVAVRGLTAALGVIGIALTVASLAFTAFGTMSAAADDANEAMIDAAGGAEAINNALAADNAEGATAEYGKLTLSLEGLTDAQKKQREEDIAAKQAALAADVERKKAVATTEDGKKAYDDAVEAQKAYNDEVDKTNQLLGGNTLLLGDNTKQLIVNALSKTTGDEDTSFWTDLAQIDPKTKAALEAAGFDAGDMIEAGMKEKGGAQKYFEGIKLKLSPEVDINALADLEEGAEDIDNTTEAIQLNAQSALLQAEAMGTAETATGAFTNGMEDAEGASYELNDQLKETVKLLTSGPLAENKAADALDTFAQSAKGTGGELDGMGKAARTNLGNFAAFMDAATEASIEAGEGTPGAIRRMISGIEALEKAGVDVTDAFALVKTAAIDMLIKTNPALAAVKNELGKSPDLKGMIKIIDAFYTARLAAEGFSGTLITEWNNAIKALEGDSTTFTVDPVVDDTKAKTALEKLQDKIEAAFKKLNIEIDVKDSIAALGKSLLDNGKNFSKFTEGGRDNIGSLQDVIDNLAVKSGGNVQKFANDLASLRKALVLAGVSGSSLTLIDNVIKKVGKTGKASTADVKAFGKALGDIGDKTASLEDIATAVGKIANSVRSAFDANFAYADSIDNITVGWEEMAAANEEAVKRIESLKEEALDLSDAIDEAANSIDEADAAIKQLTANRGKLEYQLQIAIKYGDTIRADELRAELAAVDADVAGKRKDIADANKEIAESQAKINQINSQITKSATATETINQNKALRDMAGRYAEMTSFMLINADKGSDLNKIINDQVAAFQQNAIAMGYTETQAKAVADVLRTSLLSQMDAVKEARIDLGITINTTDATDAVDDFVEDANEKLNGVKPYNLVAHTKTAKTAVQEAVDSINGKLKTIQDKTVRVTTVYQSTGGSSLGVVRAATGGLVTGPGSATSDSIAAQLSNGEYVIKASAVSHYGVDFMNALNNMSLQNAGMGGARTSAAGSQTVYLSPEDRQLLRAAIDRPIALYTDNATIAQAANDGNKLLAQRGIR